jgi:hypothetical protein
LGIGPEHTGFTHENVACKVARGEMVPDAVRVVGYMVDDTTIDNLFKLNEDIVEDITKIDFENVEEVLKEYGILK